jgi:hypothetical protein
VQGKPADSRFLYIYSRLAVAGERGEELS